MRATATLLATLAMSLTALGLAIAAPGGDDQDDARVALAAAGGSVRITNSREGHAVFTAQAMSPGNGTSGTVTIGNAGNERGRFAVRLLELHDIPGDYGGVLSQHIELVLVDRTNFQTVYDGPAAGLGQIDLGTIAPGAHREYLIAMTLPDSADNRFQGSSLSLGFEWLAGPEPVATATPNPPTAPRTPTPVTPTPTPAGPITAELGLPSARACVSRRRFTIRLKAPKGTRVKSATIAINGKVKARVKGGRTRAPVNLRGLPKGKVKVKVTVRASNGRTYVSTRTYRTCGVAKAKKKAPRRGKRR
jgi:hypothetical protein